MKEQQVGSSGNSKMKTALDKRQFGPWALVTGASSGIGKEFARQIAASGINVVLVARREELLAELGRAISQEFDVQYRALAMDLSQEGFIAGLADATHDIDIGLVVSNAGTGNPGEFLKARSSTASEDAAAQHDGASGYCSPFRRETRRATPGRPYPHRVDGRGKWGSVHGE
jgi:NAD(P)-dependent dehydrogenase (short-subunit alcohol dehydrogenase family)